MKWRRPGAGVFLHEFLRELCSLILRYLIPVLDSCDIESIIGGLMVLFDKLDERRLGPCQHLLDRISFRCLSTVTRLSSRHGSIVGSENGAK